MIKYFRPSSSSSVKVVKPDPVTVDTSKPTGNIQVNYLFNINLYTTKL